MFLVLVAELFVFAKEAPASSRSAQFQGGLITGKILFRKRIFSLLVALRFKPIVSRIPAGSVSGETIKQRILLLVAAGPARTLNIARMSLFGRRLKAFLNTGVVGVAAAVSLVVLFILLVDIRSDIVVLDGLAFPGATFAEALHTVRAVRWASKIPLDVLSGRIPTTRSIQEILAHLFPVYDAAFLINCQGAAFLSSHQAYSAWWFATVNPLSKLCVASSTFVRSVAQLHQQLLQLNPILMREVTLSEVAVAARVLETDGRGAVYSFRASHGEYIAVLADIKRHGDVAYLFEGKGGKLAFRIPLKEVLSVEPEFFKNKPQFVRIGV